MLTCTRCNGTGFINLHQISDGEMESLKDDLVQLVPIWMGAQTEPYDVSVCDCCGDGENWHGTPGEHYGAEDPQGPRGPYASNGGCCQCH